MTISGSWPTAVELTIDNSDGWNFWKVSIDGCTVVENSNGEAGASTADGGYWLDTDAMTSRQLTVSSACAPPTDTAFSVCASTTNADFADTPGEVTVKLQQDGIWSSAVSLFTGVPKGATNCVNMDYSGSSPTAIELAIDSTNGWGYWKVTVDGSMNGWGFCTAYEHSAGRDGASYADGGDWLDMDTDTSRQFTVTPPTAAPTASPTDAPTSAPTPAPTLLSCSCIPCGTAPTGNHYTAGFCSPASGTCSATTAGAGCYTQCAAGCDCASSTCVITGAPTAAPTAAPTMYQLLHAGSECAVEGDTNQGVVGSGGSGYMTLAECAASACDSDGINCRQWIEYGTFGQGE
jgi:hypothetical protein